MPLPHLVLGGPMGAGKTTIGRLVAERAGVPFVDLDLAILRACATRGLLFPSAAALFTRLGERAFRRLEAEAFAGALAAPAPTVIATGGGALARTASRDQALSAARVVTLTAPASTLLARLGAPGQPRRPLLEEAPDPGEFLDSLLAERATAYAEAHATIATHCGSREEAAAAVERAWQAPSVLVRLGPRSYPIRFAGAARAGLLVADVLAALRPTGWLLVTDTTVDALWGSSLRAPPGDPEPDRPAAGAAVASAVTEHSTHPEPAAVVRLEPGERRKNLAAVEHILHSALAAGLDRSAVIVAHGGGVVSDIAGFAAAILMRGVRWISVPTTLLSMADAAIGGKTGVDLGPAKNAAGAFHQPSAVIVDVRHTTTEPERAFTSGLAEIVKAGAIARPDLVTLLEREPAAVRGRSLPILEIALGAAASVKAEIVASDEREAGARALLNFGHTLGHALEAAGGFERWTHGEAISLGMVAALRVGAALDITEPATSARIVALLAQLGLPTELALADIESAVPFLSLDKKRRGTSVRAVFLAEIGRAITRDVPLADLATLYRAAATVSC